MNVRNNKVSNDSSNDRDKVMAVITVIIWESQMTMIILIPADCLTSARPLNIFGLYFTKRKKERLGERILFGIPIPNCVVLPENPSYNTGF